jgi:2-keto-3-deoxy-L-rhamnonate aldolase RhmA
MINLESRIGKVLVNGGRAKGIEHFESNLAMVEIAAKAGFDFNMIDLQLPSFDLETMEFLIAASQNCGITSIVRVPEMDIPLINRVLNMGVNGIAVPEVDSADMAKRVVEAIKYQPAGKRMACPMIRAADYGLTPWKEYSESSDNNLMSCVLVENERGVNHLEEIAAVPGLDILWLGASDLSLSLGIPGANYTHPVLKYWLQKAGEMARKYNLALFATTAVNTTPEYFNMVSSEANMICVYSDMGIFLKSCQRIISGIGL